MDKTKPDSFCWFLTKVHLAARWSLSIILWPIGSPRLTHHCAGTVERRSGTTVQGRICTAESCIDIFAHNSLRDGQQCNLRFSFSLISRDASHGLAWQIRAMRYFKKKNRVGMICICEKADGVDRRFTLRLHVGSGFSFFSRNLLIWKENYRDS